MRWLVPLVLCAGVLPALSAAEGASSSPSPFAGGYEGYVPGGGSVLCSIGVSDAGTISGWGRWGSPIYFVNVNVTGSVSADGRMRCTVHTSSPVRGRRGTTTTSRKFNAWVSLDSAGNIVGATDDGASFTWYRR